MSRENQRNNYFCLHMCPSIGLAKILTNTYIFECLINHVYIKNTLLLLMLKLKIYFLDHDAVRIVLRIDKFNFSVII